MVAGTQLGAEQWLAEAERGSLGCSCQCDRRLQDFVKQSDEPSQIEAPNAAQLCNWDGNGPVRGSSLCLTFWEFCSRRLCGGRGQGRGEEKEALQIISLSAWFVMN